LARRATLRAGRACLHVPSRYLRSIALRRFTPIGFDEVLAGDGNSLTWMSEMIDLKKERHFFETWQIEYQSSGALSWN